MTSKKPTEDIPAKTDLEAADSAELTEDKKEWKEVQLRISENGEMCITGVDDSSLIREEDASNCNITFENEAPPLPASESVPKCDVSSEGKPADALVVSEAPITNCVDSHLPDAQEEVLELNSKVDADAKDDPNIKTDPNTNTDVNVKPVANVKTDTDTTKRNGEAANVASTISAQKTDVLEMANDVTITSKFLFS